MPTNTASSNGRGTPAPRVAQSESRRPTNVEYTDQEILETVWYGRKTGNLFKASASIVEDGERQIVYNKPGKQPGQYKIPFSSFIQRFRPATVDELWHMIHGSAAAQENDGEQVDMGRFVEPDHRHELDRMILWRSTQDSIRVGLNLIQRRAEINAVFGLDQIEPRTKRTAMNFYGLPGTGKTLAAVAVAKMLGTKLYQVDYSEIISKYQGDTAKHIKQAFRIARENGAAMFWDEADALLSKRVGMGGGDQSFATSINQNRSQLLNELDAFDGVIIFATNFFSNYDDAFLRRIARHVEFKLPDVSMRVELFKLHLPVRTNVTMAEGEFEEIANASNGFSGGDILNACVNGITRASMSEEITEWQLSAEDLLCEIKHIADSKEAHSNGPQRSSNLN